MEQASGFSIIIPVLHEGARIKALVEDLQRFRDKRPEIVIVDGSADGDTIEILRDAGTASPSYSPISSSPGRGRQMNAGAAAARGGILIFLHADTVLPDDALEQIEFIMKNRHVAAGAFDLAFDSKKLLLRLIASAATIRSRLNKIPYGDQAIFVRKSVFSRIGGYREIPLMEDVDLMRRIKKDGGEIRFSRSRVRTSSRRYEDEGTLRCALRNCILILAFFCGISPERLAAYYRQ